MTDSTQDALADLLPCPFCGKPPAVEMTGFHLGGRTIRCETDDCMGPHTTAGCVDDATIQWNTRAALRAPNQPVEAIKFGYTNWRGETSYRHATPISFRYGVSEYHKTPGWLMLAFDLEKNEQREFSMRDMLLVEPDTAIYATPPSPQETRRALEEIAATLKYSKIANSEAALMVQQIVKDALATSTAPAGGETKGQAILKHCDELHDLGFQAGWNGAIEECAKIADDHTPAKHDGTLAAHVTGVTISKAIRSLTIPDPKQAMQDGDQS